MTQIIHVTPGFCQYQKVLQTNRKRLTATHHKVMRWLYKAGRPVSPKEVDHLPFWAFQSLVTKGYATIVVDPDRGNLFCLTAEGRNYSFNIQRRSEQHVALS